jgi:hypothetical protein
MWFSKMPVTVALAMVLVATGCHTVKPATVVNSEALNGKKQLYVVQSTRKDRGFQKEIERNLRDRGYTVTSGPLESMGAEPDLYLVYDDRWAWDMVMYPSRVNIAIHDARTRAVVGSAEFKNTFFHTYPDPPEIADELIGRIFGEPAGKYMR